MENNSFVNKHAISTAHNKTYLFLPFTFRRVTLAAVTRVMRKSLESYSSATRNRLLGEISRESGFTTYPKNVCK